MCVYMCRNVRKHPSRKQHTTQHRTAQHSTAHAASRVAKGQEQLTTLLLLLLLTAEDVGSTQQRVRAAWPVLLWLPALSVHGTSEPDTLLPGSVLLCWHLQGPASTQSWGSTERRQLLRLLLQAWCVCHGQLLCLCAHLLQANRQLSHLNPTEPPLGAAHHNAACLLPCA